MHTQNEAIEIYNYNERDTMIITIMVIIVYTCRTILCYIGLQEKRNTHYDNKELGQKRRHRHAIQTTLRCENNICKKNSGDTVPRGLCKVRRLGAQKFFGETFVVENRGEKMVGTSAGTTSP